MRADRLEYKLDRIIELLEKVVENQKDLKNNNTIECEHNFSIHYNDTGGEKYVCSKCGKEERVINDFNTIK